MNPSEISSPYNYVSSRYQEKDYCTRQARHADQDINVRPESGGPTSDQDMVRDEYCTVWMCATLLNCYDCVGNIIF